MSTCLLISGGLDSGAAWHALGKPPALYCGGSFGPARHANLGEMAAIDNMLAICPELAEKLTIVEFDFRPFMRRGRYTFPRDKILCMLAWANGFDGVQFGWVKDDGTTEKHAAATSAKFAGVIEGPFSVEFPVAHMTKRELVKAALAEGCPPEFLQATHSCVRSTEPCGTCENCKQRKRALRGLRRLVAA